MITNFIRTTKIAGGTIINGITNSHKEFVQDNNSRIPHFNRWVSPRHIFNVFYPNGDFDSKLPNNSWTFTVVRNPWDRAVSSWCHFVRESLV